MEFDESKVIDGYKSKTLVMGKKYYVADTKSGLKMEVEMERHGLREFRGFNYYNEAVSEYGYGWNFWYEPVNTR